jgi:PAS domain S-box-containing protein
MPAVHQIKKRMINYSSLRFRFVVLIAVVVVPLVGYAFLNALQVEKNAVAQAKISLQGLLTLAAVNQDQKVESVRQVLLTLAETPNIFALSTSACEDYLSGLKARFPEYSAFGLLSPNGKLRCNSYRLPPGTDFSKRNHFKRAMVTGQFAVGNYQRNLATNKEEIIFSLPIRMHDGSITGVVTASIGLDVLFKSLSFTKMPPMSRLFVLDRQGTVLASSDPDLQIGAPTPIPLVLKKVRELAADQESGLFVDNNETRVFVFPEKTEKAQLELFTVASQDKLAITQAARDDLLIHLAILGLIATLASILAVGVANRSVSRPAAEILHSIDKIGTGDLQVRVRLEMRGVATEMKGIAQGINQMAQGIEQRMQAQQRLHNALLGIVQASSTQSGEAFLVELTRHMISALCADAGFIACYASDNFLKIRTVTGIVDGQRVENSDYAIGDGYAQSLKAQACLIVPQDFAAQYPKFPLLAVLPNLQPQAYVRWRLDDSNGRPMGIIFVLFRKPLMDTDFLTSTLNIFAARTCAELERQRDDKLLRRRAALLDLAQDAIIVRDLNNRIEYWNAGAARMYGWSAQEARGQVISKLINEEDRTFQSASEQVITTGEWRGELKQQRKDGRVLWVEGNWTLVLDDAGKPVSFFAIYTDITKRRAAQMELQQLNLELEGRVHLRTAQLEKANRDLESFSYSVSHDLRAPLGTITGFSQLLAKTDEDKISEKGKHYLGRIRNGAKQMGELIEGLLSLAQMSHQPVDVQEVDLSLLARRVEQACREREPERQVQLHIQDGLNARGDPRLLMTVMQNLLGNAWKFSARQEQARIDVGRDTGVDGQPHYFVKDNGAGFDMAQAEKLFGTFERLHSQAEFSGTGVGLATVQRVVQRHGGRVWAESQVNEGATFYFTLGLGPDTDFSRF